VTPLRVRPVPSLRLLRALLLLPALSFAGVRLELERNPIRADESVELSFTADGEADGDPDFGPLEADFEVLGTSASSEYSWVNGRSAALRLWVVTVLPKHGGNLTVPPIRFGSVSSNSLTLAVGEVPQAATGAQQAEVFWEVEAVPRNPFVQSQVIYTRRLLRRVDVVGDGLSDPQVADALVQRLGEGRQYAEVRGGETYTVNEYKYAIFPQKSGPLHIEPAALNAQLMTGGGGRLAPLVRRPGKRLRVASDSLDLEVRPIPASFTGSHWLPAEALELAEQWPQEPPRSRVGEPISRTVTLRAAGATVGVLPELGQGAVPAGLKSYADQPLLKEEAGADGITSLRQEKQALLADRAGNYTLPGLEVIWWNTRSERQEVTHLAPRLLTVAAAAGAVVAPEPEPAASVPAPPTPPPLPLAPGAAADGWRWLALALGGGWAVTAAAWSRSRRKRPLPAAAGARSAAAMTPDSATALRELTKACRGDDPVAARDALLIWGQACWPQRRPANLQDLAKLTGGRLGEKIRELERLVYGPDHGHRWYGEELWRALQQQPAATEGPARSRRRELEPLNRIGDAG